MSMEINSGMIKIIIGKLSMKEDAPTPVHTWLVMMKAMPIMMPQENKRWRLYLNSVRALKRLHRLWERGLSVNRVRELVSFQIAV